MIQSKNIFIPPHVVKEFKSTISFYHGGLLKNQLFVKNKPTVHARQSYGAVERSAASRGPTYRPVYGVWWLWLGRWVGGWGERAGERDRQRETERERGGETWLVAFRGVCAGEGGWWA